MVRIETDGRQQDAQLSVEHSSIYTTDEVAVVCSNAPTTSSTFRHQPGMHWILPWPCIRVENLKANDIRSMPHQAPTGGLSANGQLSLGCCGSTDARPNEMQDEGMMAGEF
jgi:hypothetical protein